MKWMRKCQLFNCIKLHPNHFTSQTQYLMIPSCQNMWQVMSSFVISILDQKIKIFQNWEGANLPIYVYIQCPWISNLKMCHLHVEMNFRKLAHFGASKVHYSPICVWNGMEMCIMIHHHVFEFWVVHWKLFI
jgi:hypothetical protein